MQLALEGTELVRSVGVRTLCQLPKLGHLVSVGLLHDVHSQYDSPLTL